MKKGERMGKKAIRVNPEYVVELYDVLFCPFCGCNNMYSAHWANRVSKCPQCNAHFQVIETYDSERINYDESD